MLRNIHRILGRFLAAFLVLHFLTHLSALFGPDIHVRTLTIAQKVYRNILIEPLLLIAIATQVGAGVRLFFERRHAALRNVWSRIQLISGLYLAIFFLVHLAFRAGRLDVCGLLAIRFAGHGIWIPVKHANGQALNRAQVTVTRVRVTQALVRHVAVT